MHHLQSQNVLLVKCDTDFKPEGKLCTCIHRRVFKKGVQESCLFIEHKDFTCVISFQEQEVIKEGRNF